MESSFDFEIFVFLGQDSKEESISRTE